MLMPLTRGMSDTNGNRLIRVACGQTSNIFPMHEFKQPSTQSSTTPIVPASTKSIPSNSILNTQAPDLAESQRSSSRVLPMLLDKDYLEYDQDTMGIIRPLDVEKKVTTTNSPVKLESYQKTKSVTSVPASKDGSGFWSILNQDFLFIVAVVSGISIVLIAINVFCIWNYYKYVHYWLHLFVNKFNNF